MDRVCVECKNPLKQIKGGPNQERFVHVHVWGCMNPDCPKKMLEQDRSETPLKNFNE
jgi:hypothetical protein